MKYMLRRCKICNEEKIISKYIGVCLDCIRNKPEKSLKIIENVHIESRKAFNLPLKKKGEKGIKCKICVHECVIPEGDYGFCGLRKNEKGKLISYEGILEYYYDPLPTNCVAESWCAATGSGYPRYSYKDGIEYGYKNLAVFYGACSYNCLFCQNWTFKELTVRKKPRFSPEELASKVDEKTACICYFGGDPSVQIVHAIKTSKIALENNRGRILRICFESNGTLNKNLLKKAAELSYESGGTIKFDLKAFDENLHYALTYTTNKRTFENFQFLAENFWRREPPSLVASTLLVPGYVDEKEVENIAKFISSLNDEIPYALLAFYPHFYMKDLPTTSKEHAFKCYKIAKKYLKNVRLGNVHLLS